MSMVSYLSTVQHVNCFPAFTQSHKPNRDHLRRLHTLTVSYQIFPNANIMMIVPLEDDLVNIS